MQSKGSIIAVVTLASETILPGGVPVFVASGPEEREKVSTYLSRITDAQVHDLENGVYVLVRH